MNFNVKDYIEQNSSGRILVKFADFPTNTDSYSIKNDSPEEKVLLALDRRTFSSADKKIGQALINLCKKNYQLADLSRRIIENFIKQQKNSHKKQEQLKNKLVKTYQPCIKKPFKEKPLEKKKEINIPPPIDIELLKAVIDEVIKEAKASDDMKDIILEALLEQNE